YTAKDKAGNAATAVTRTVKVGDQTAPVITLKGTAIQTVAQGSIFTDAGSTVTDNVDQGLIATVTGKVNTALVGTYILTYTAKDKAGNAATAVTRTVKVTDQTAPIVTAPASITVAAVNASGTPATHAKIFAFLIAATAKDNVDATSTVTNNAPTQFPLGLTTVIFTSIDKAGNQGTVTATINVIDQTSPIVTAPASITVGAVDAKGTTTSNNTISVFLAGASASDNVDFSSIVTHNAPYQFPLGLTTVIFTSVDKAGNQGTATATVVVTDQTAPVIVLKGTAIQIVAQGSLFTDAGSTVTDNVDQGLIAMVTGKVNTALVGSYILTYTVQDTAGNAAIAVTRTVKVTDQTPPIVTAPTSITVATVNASGTPATHAKVASFLLAATAKDNVDAISTVTQNAPIQFPLGLTTVTFTSIDKAGNKGTSTATVKVTDQTPPIVTAPASITVAAVNASGTPATHAKISAFLIAGTAKDNVDVTSTVINNAPTQFPLGLTTVIFTSIDKAGNKGTSTATVKVSDQTAPVITLTGANPLTVAQGSVFVDPSSTVTDNVDKGLIATVTGTVNTAIAGIYTLTYTVKDKAGNAALWKVRTVTVAKDNVPPVLTLTGKASVLVAVGSSYKDPGATALDNIDGNLTAKIVVSNLVNSAVLGTYTVTYNVKDSVGNTATPLVRTVKVTDQTPPVVTAPKPLILTTLDTYAIAATDPYITAFLAQASATDNIDKVLTISNDAPVTFPVGVTTVTFTSIDKAGNQGTTTATVTVQGRLFVGLTTRSLLLTDITRWEGKSGHKVQRIQHFYDFSAPAYLWTNEVPSALNAGYKVVLTMEPRVGVNDGVTHLRDIYAGIMDPYIDATINGIKNNILTTWPNADIWMRFGHEMNGDWYPWGSDFNQGTTVRHLGNTAQDYINAYRHVVDRFRAAGLGSNVVKWVFSPNVWYKDNMSQFYPGNAYVDMISVSGFNFGTKATSQPTLTWQTFNQIHQLTYNLLTGLYPTKPYFIAGISSAELGGPTGKFGVDKAAWIDDMTVQLSQAYPKLQGVFWFDENKKASGEADWRIDSSTQSLGATQRMYSKQGLWKP
ncbi:MAG: DUF5011 domain-containing protein, partial [Zetaproteobacteria bacterium]|nr:DUF5011 domain-containing protein [Zetaproteobacteria bacterium]